MLLALNQSFLEIAACDVGEWQCPDLECINFGPAGAKNPLQDLTNLTLFHFWQKEKLFAVGGAHRRKDLGVPGLPAVFSNIFHK